VESDESLGGLGVEKGAAVRLPSGGGRGGPEPVVSGPTNPTQAGTWGRKRGDARCRG